MEIYGKLDQPEAEFTIETKDDLDLREAVANPEAYRDCLVRVMLAANRGSVGAIEAVRSTVLDSRGNNLAMACGKCGITLVRDSGVVYGASKCSEVVSRELSVGELA
jgi:hypothetical protein